METNIFTRRGRFFALAFLAFIVGWLMVWRVILKDDVPPATRLQSVTGSPERWGKSRHYGTFFCLREVRFCLTFAEPVRSNYDLDDQLRRGLPVSVRYDAKHPTQWGGYPFYYVYEIAVDGRMAISYDDMREERVSTRHFAVGAAAFSFTAFVLFCFLGFRTPVGRIFGMPSVGPERSHRS